MIRVVEPELLDELPANDPRALHSRRDLRLINSWMGNARHLIRSLEAIRPRPKTIVELGAGDGRLMLKIARTLAPKWKSPVQLQLLDMKPVVSSETLQAFREMGWCAEVLASNLQDWLNGSAQRVDLIVANLFLHHFREDDLRVFFGHFGRMSHAFVSCDPRRWQPSLWTINLLPLLGCNGVTLHDARISIRAGFRASELTALWPAGSGFHLSERAAGYASHLFCASRL